MALIRVMVALAIVAAAAAPALAKDIVVGDDSGWKLNFDYQKWADGKEFRVGDKLIFKYQKGAHNVIRVDGDGFRQCAQPENNEVLTTGNDVITLSGPGKKWYICGVGDHCENGMKLVINVLGQEGSNKGSGSSAAAIAPTFLAWMIAAFSVFALMMMI